MIMDSLLLLDPSGTAVTAGGASTNTIDLSQNRDIGVGDDALQVVVCVDTAFAAAGAATLQVQFQTSTDNAIWTTLTESDAIAKGSLTVGTEVYKTAVPQGCQRYLRLNYVVGTGPFTAGALHAAIVIDRPNNKAYPSGFSTANI